MELNGKKMHFIPYLVRKSTVCIANNRNRNGNMCLNTRNIPTTGYARML